MLKRDDLIKYLDHYLSCGSIKDYCPNGLQVEGQSEVRKIVTSVSASEELFNKAVSLNADMVIVHHGILWENRSPVIKGGLHKRISVLLENRISLLGYHLPLDRHPIIGNNILGAKGLGLVSIKPFGENHGALIGYMGGFKKPVPAKDLFGRVNKLYGAKSQVFPYGPDMVKTIGIVSGGAANMVSDAVKHNLDAYLTGEVTESIVQESKEESIHFIAAGHYATERLGIRALGKHIASKFKIAVEYIDVPVPV